ncbi:MAG: DUF6737 family protein [Prochlorococcus sp.]|jgi:hypothetical protein|nr:hypothetical protein [Prochlorococcaceae cyanobacterium ETNP2_MAG_10]MDP6196284.1 hypothetical protein [Prochlorococcaceae cyanobacterium ETNP18_MAG_17]HJO78020.1 DUF6737 family protein [Prochlorococcaceae cyanobacterium Fu_MAG_134]|tara:strand:- start:1002 stop:1259 length:258 start_codon:yes stop_codon:yes gene_type:complete
MSSDQEKLVSTDFWSEKPPWCQPWSILLTGIGLLAISWWCLHLLWFTTLLGLGVFGWWGLFLVIAPLAYRQQIQQQGLEQDQVSS